MDPVEVFQQAMKFRIHKQKSIQITTIHKVLCSHTCCEREEGWEGGGRGEVM